MNNKHLNNKAMTHKTRKSIDEQQKQSGMEAEELLFELDQLRIKYKGYKPDIEESNPRIDESIELINQFKSDVINDALALDDSYPLKDVLMKLQQAAKYLLNEKNYDGPDYEELEQCVNRVDAIITKLNAPEPKDK